MTYSPIALIFVLTLLAMALPCAASGGDIRWKRTVIDKEFRSEGVCVADVNRDGKLDILAGNLWYEAPNWTPHEIAPIEKFDAATGYSNSFINFACDMDGDGWMDQIVVGMPGGPAVWRKNPGSRPGHWKSHEIWHSACNESQAYADLLGNGKPVLVFPYDETYMAWYEPTGEPTKPYAAHVVSAAKQPGTQRFSHGLGVGDITGDGRADIITTDGYYAAPVDPRSGPWKFVPVKLGGPCAQMLVYDVNGDGLPDVVSSSAHNVGIWWHEQRKGADGPEFVEHVIDTSFSQSHALVMADINGDGVMDFVTGKRFWAHGPSGDVNPSDPCMLCWFELKRTAGKVQWVRHVIDSDSGVGTQFLVADINGDGLLDVITSNKKGVYCFEQQRTR